MVKSGGVIILKKAIVLGATGGMGSALVYELIDRGVQVTAFARGTEKLHQLFSGDPLVEIYEGDAFSGKDLDHAVNGNEVVFHAINLPYANWHTKLLTLTKNIIASAEKNNAKLAIVDNIYSYGKSHGENVKENDPKQPHTKKGKLRLHMESLYKQSNVPYVIAHFPDFYGPYAENSFINFTLTKMVTHEKAKYVGDLSIAREYIFTPDGAKALVDLASIKKAYNQNWNIPGYDVITGQEIIRLTRTFTGCSEKVSSVSKNMLRFAGLFNRQMREMVELYYLNEEPVILDGSKYEKNIGSLPKTPYEIGIKQTIQAISFNEKNFTHKK